MELFVFEILIIPSYLSAGPLPKWYAFWRMYLQTTVGIFDRKEGAVECSYTRPWEYFTSSCFCQPWERFPNEEVVRVWEQPP